MTNTVAEKKAVLMPDDDEVIAQPDGAETESDDHGDAAEGAGEVKMPKETSRTTPKETAETEETPEKKATKTRRRVSVSIRALVVGVVIFGLVVATGVMTWLYIGATTKLDEQARQAANYKRAEQIALDYAVNAAIMDYKDLGPWKNSLVKDTTPELKEKLSKAGNAMEQILTPLQWISTAKPLTAKVRQNNNGVYVVDAFVGVMTKTVQAPDSLQSTATYSITVDSNHDWQISDVGGIAGVLGEK
jgi:Mce-associated membrane protein